jgi:hypothetical protein
LLGDIQQLQVKPIPVDCGNGKEIASNGPFEKLEPALGIADTADSPHSDNRIEASAQDSPVPAGVHSEIAALQGQAA